MHHSKFGLSTSEMGTGREHMQQTPCAGCDNLIDHLVGECEQQIRHGEAQRPGGLKIDDQLVLDWSLDRQVGGLLALEDAVDVAGRPPIIIEHVISIGQEATTLMYKRYG